MSFFYQLDPENKTARRTAEGLLRLREKLARELPARTISDTLMLATWNIREFDSNKYGERTPECLAYIAEVISHFDVIAVQEVNADLQALGMVQKVLGDWWKFLVTDVTAGNKGNQERMAYIYDSRKVKFGGLAGEIVIPPEKGAEQLARTPFVCGFETGWLKFMLCTVHIYYGQAIAEDPTRIKEIESLSKFLADHVKKTRPGAEISSYSVTSTFLRLATILSMLCSKPVFLFPNNCSSCPPMSIKINITIRWPSSAMLTIRRLCRSV